jgi:archaellum component FlaC
MAVMMPRQSWTDERLDHFERSVNERFDRVDERFDRVDERFDRVDERFRQIDGRLERIEDDLHEVRNMVMGVQRTMAQGFIALCTVMAGGFAALAGIVG